MGADFGGNVPTESIRGLITEGEHMVMLLDVNTLVAEPGVDASTA